MAGSLPGVAKKIMVILIMPVLTGILPKHVIWLFLLVASLGFSSGVNAQIAQRGSATTATTSNTTISINKPTGVQPGDVMIMIIAKTNYSAAPTSSGWNLIAGARQGGGDRYAAVLYKVVDGTEGTNFSVSLGTGNTSGSGSIIAFSGVSPAVFDVTPGSLSTGGGTTATASGITTTSDNAAVIFLGGTGNTNWSNWSGTNPSLTEIVDDNNGAVSVGAAWGIQSTAGITGNGTVDLGPGSGGGGFYYGVMMIALQPGELTSPYTFTSSGTFTVPAGVTSLTVELWGAGGGGSNRGGAAGGGGGGAYTKANLTGLTPGSTMSVTVGTGGAAGLPKTAPGNYSRVTVGSYTITANGGLSVNDSRNGGAGGTAQSVTGAITAAWPGGSGGDARSSAIFSNNEAGGGGGGSAFTNNNGGDGSNGGSSSNNASVGGSGTGSGGQGAAADGTPGATAGTAPGGGGGGRGEGGSSSQAGADGQVIITWSTCTSVGDPTVFGTNIWNVYAYDGQNINLTGITYKGYYTESNFSFTTTDRWNPSNGSPSNAFGYQGCPVPADYHTFVHKRKGFPPGNYQITVRHDDAYQLIIDGSIVASSNTWDGNTPVVLTTIYKLDENTEVEFRVAEVGGESRGSLNFVQQCNAPDTPTLFASETEICSGESTTLSIVSGNLNEGDYWQWYSGSCAGTAVGQGTSIEVSPTATTTYYVRGVGSDCDLTTCATITITVENQLTSTAASPSPANGATGICFAGNGAVSSVTWGAVAGATSYDVYFGAGSLPEIPSGNTTGTSFITGTLSVNTTYYWKVIPKNNCGETTGTPGVWSFTTAGSSCVSYCMPVSNNSGVFISNFSTTGGKTNIENNTGYSGNGYNDYTNLTASQTAGSMINWSLTYEVNSQNFSDASPAIWIDWNSDGDFSDVNETIYYPGSYQNEGTYTGNFSVPASQQSGSYRLRILLDYLIPTPQPCEFYLDNQRRIGEAEDYTISVVPACANPTNGGIIAGNQTICSGGDPAAFTSSAASGHTGTLEYKWQLSTTGSGSGFGDISGATGAAYDVPAGLSQTTWYRRLARVTCATDGWNTAAASNVLEVTVTPNVTPTFTQVAAICSGGSLAALPTTSNNGITGSWSPALNNAATTTYTFTPTAGQCATTTTMTIVVNPLPTVTSSAGNTKTYTGVANTTTVSATASSGAAIDWYASSTGGSPLASGTNTYAPTGVNVGAYTVYAEARNTTTGCVSAGRTPVTLTINKTDLSVTAVASNITYGNAAPTVTVEYSGFVAGENASVLDDVGFVLGTNYTQGNGVGIYNTTISMGTATDNNYSLNLNTSTFDVSARAITITADAKSKTYGTADPALTWQVTSGSLAFSDAFTGTLTREAGETVGTYEIRQGSVALTSNYNLTYIPANFTISALTIAVTADAQTKVYGDADPALTYQFSPALVSGDAFTGALTRAAGEAAGTYAISQGALALSSNYTLNFTGNDLTITAKSLTPQITADNKCFDGTTDVTLSSQTLSGIVGSDVVSLDVGSVAFDGVGPGPVEVTATGLILTGAGADNYVLSSSSATTTAVIHPLPATGEIIPD